MDKITVLGIAFTKGSKKEILEYFWKKVKRSGKSFYIVTPNPEMVMKSREDKEFRDILNKAEIALVDGVGIVWAARFLGISALTRVTGVDFMDRLCHDSVEKAATIGFLGGRNGVAEKTAKCLKERYPGLRVVFVSDEWGEEGFKKARKISESFGKTNGLDLENKSPQTIDHIDILFVAFGFPKQEKWMSGNLGKVPVKSMMGVGGAFDYISGDVKRAPEQVRRLGLEWLYRLVQEPWRAKRMLALPKFVLMVLQARI